MNNVSFVSQTANDEDIKYVLFGKILFFAGYMLLSFLGFCVIYILFSDPYCYGFFKSSLLSTPYFFLILTLVLTIILSIHFIRLKLVFWRIFLQTFLAKESKVYEFFSHGYMVRVIGVLVAFACALKILVFFCLIKVNFDQFIGLYIGFLVFLIFRLRSVYGGESKFLRGDINNILKMYLSPFLIATATGVCISFWEIGYMEEIQQISSISEVLEITIAAIDPNNNIFWRPVRILLKHIYAYELLVQQLVQVPVMGPALYFIYLVASEGAITFFSIFLLFMPYKMEEKNG